MPLRRLLLLLPSLALAAGCRQPVGRHCCGGKGSGRKGGEVRGGEGDHTYIVEIFRFWPKTMDYSKAFWPKSRSFFNPFTPHWKVL